MSVLFVAMNNMGNEFTGGDRIWIELLNRAKFHVGLYACPEAWNLLKGIQGRRVEPTIINILKNTIVKTYRGLSSIPKRHYDYVYSVSDFYPDLLTAFVYKMRHKGCKWIAGYYLVAASPFAPDSPYHGFNWFKGLLYWLMQRISLWLVNRNAEIVFVTSEPDRKHFPKKKVVVVRGGVDLDKLPVNDEPIPVEKRKYDAIYIGRFHYQKGVLELVDIWIRLSHIRPNVRLVMVGDGPLLEQCKRIATGHNIDFPGFKEGKEKYDLIKDSKIALHPATFDSGGMAVAEPMALGLPAVGFDLPAYKTYYPKGMVKASDSKEFISSILWLLDNKDIYELFSGHAKNLIKEEWDWNKRTEDIWRECLM